MKEFENFFRAAEPRIARLGYMIWDIHICPEIVIIDSIDDSFRCSYDLHTTIFGTPNEKILDNFNPAGRISLSFDLGWKDLIQSNFSDFVPMDKSVRNKDMNTFLCMDLKKDNFRPQSEYISRELTKDEIKLLGLKRRILFSQGLGGVGIIENDELIGCAFSPHHVQTERFSFALIRGVWVGKEHRNKGLGYDLSIKMCDFLIEKGIELITLWVEETNLPAVRIYEKLGFRIAEKVFGVDCIKKEK